MSTSASASKPAAEAAKPEAKKVYRLTEEMRVTIDRFFFNHYCQSFRSGAFARANSTMCVSYCAGLVVGCMG